MEQKEVIKKTLEDLRIETSEDNLFVFETLLEKGEMKRIVLVNMLKEKGVLDAQITVILNALNKANLITWEVVKGIATIWLTKHAKKEFAVAYLSLTGEEYKEKVKSLLEFGEKAMNNFIKKEVRPFKKRAKKLISKTLRNLASEVDKK
jgi:hypothetical protein